MQQKIANAVGYLILGSLLLLLGDATGELTSPQPRPVAALAELAQ